MIERDFTKLENELQQIADKLLLNGTLTGCPGIVHGKMGIAIFFFHYAKYTKIQLFADYALDLIAEMQNQLHANYRPDYEKGISGIGVGVYYLTQNEFLDVDDDIFEDFDERMYRAVMYDPCLGFSLYEGLTGYGRYWMCRLHQQPFSAQAIKCLIHITEQVRKKLLEIPMGEKN